MLNSNSIKSFTDMRLNPGMLAQLASDTGPVYILNRNKPVSVLIDVNEYESMMEELQDSRDSLWLKENEGNLLNAKGITASDLAKKYKLKVWRLAIQWSTSPKPKNSSKNLRQILAHISSKVSCLLPITPLRQTTISKNSKTH